MMPYQCVVIGAGAWGSALALHLARSGHAVALWGQDSAHLKEMAATRKNQTYLGDFIFPKNLHIASSLSDALQQKPTPVILMAVPSVGFLATLKLIASHVSEPVGIISVTKGLSDEGALLSTLIETIFPGMPYSILSGPSFALEVAKNLPTAVTCASKDAVFREKTVKLFHQGTFRVYQSDDVIGVCLGGCLKNVLAIAVGISDGLGLGANARAALITRGLAELMRLGSSLGAESSTFMGLAGLGDLVLTCTDNQSRNRRFGIYLGEGKSVAEALALVNRSVEGHKNAAQVNALAQRHQVEMPICEMVYQILYQSKPTQAALLDLMSRAPTSESSQI
jgi:glycerol-3-phosphate dehydrogenase (NAD(P)+)